MRLAARTCHDRFTRRELFGIVDRAGRHGPSHFCSAKPCVLLNATNVGGGMLDTEAIELLTFAVSRSAPRRIVRRQGGLFSRLPW
jgi:hypothetical protein